MVWKRPGEDLSISSKANALVLFNPVIDNGSIGFEYDRFGDCYIEIRPMHNIRKEAPLAIIVVGTKDKLIPVSKVEDYKSKMEAVGGRCDLHLYEAQPYGFFNKEKGDRCYKNTVRKADLFLKSIGCLKGEPTL